MCSRTWVSKILPVTPPPCTMFIDEVKILDDIRYNYLNVNVNIEIYILVLFEIQYAY
jgi:hypothetical protein